MGVFDRLKRKANQTPATAAALQVGPGEKLVTFHDLGMH